jgi:Cu-Zn family superoxide dismutase
MRSRVLALALALPAAALGAPDGRTAAGGKAVAPKTPPVPKTAIAHVRNPEGKVLGDALLRETPNGVLVTLELAGLPAGSHAVHVHEHGRCEPPFQSAGGHFNPAKKHHGFENAAGYHAGDLPNVRVGADGKVSAEFLARNLTLKPGTAQSLLDGDGTALVVHGGADDYRSDPAGASGDRIACGAIERAIATPDVPGSERPTAGTR